MKKLILGLLLAGGMLASGMHFTGQIQAEYVPPNLSPTTYHADQYIPPNI